MPGPRLSDLAKGRGVEERSASVAAAAAAWARVCLDRCLTTGAAAPEAPEEPPAGAATVAHAVEMIDAAAMERGVGPQESPAFTRVASADTIRLACDGVYWASTEGLRRCVGVATTGAAIVATIAGAAASSEPLVLIESGGT